MKYILSWGGGVNSTAMLAMIKLGMLPELNKDNCHIIFADTGAEMPFTYEHTNNCLAPMTRDGWTCKSISPHTYPEFYSKRCKNKGLPQYCFDKQVIPSRINRWCTIEYKSTPIKNYRKDLGETTLILGIAADEKHRVKSFEDTIYPLVDQDIDREGCIKLIVKASLPEARKSGCYFCPYQRKAQWIELYKDYPDLFKESEKLEAHAKAKFKDDKGYYLREDRSIRDMIRKWAKMNKEDCKQGEMFEDNRHCLCEL